MYEKLRIQISNVKNIRNSNHYLGILYLKDYRGLNFRNKQRSNSEWNTVRLLNLIKEPVFFYFNDRYNAEFDSIFDFQRGTQYTKVYCKNCHGQDLRDC